ncbi:hypothetical protein EMGBD4_16680 [Verrucomicrobiota bacterium]|nr:hypothetical protein EMGBD4_16680 [Verrucomicrobiota bacterium]
MRALLLLLLTATLSAAGLKVGDPAPPRARSRCSKAKR